MNKNDEQRIYGSMLEMIHKIIVDFAESYHGAMDSSDRMNAFNRAKWEILILKDFAEELFRADLLSMGMADSICRRLEDALTKIASHVEVWDDYLDPNDK